MVLSMEQEEGCQTPIHSGCRIPAEVMACSPPPKKKPAVYPGQKVPPKSGYFNPPDLELIFRVAPTREALA